MANAYVFNTTYLSVSLYFNGAPAGELPGAGRSGGYAPPSATFGFDPSGGADGSGFGADTRLALQFGGGGSEQIYRVNAGQIPRGQDLRLFLFWGRAVLSWDSDEAILTPSG